MRNQFGNLGAGNVFTRKHCLHPLSIPDLDRKAEVMFTWTELRLVATQMWWDIYPRDVDCEAPDLEIPVTIGIHDPESRSCHLQSLKVRRRVHKVMIFTSEHVLPDLRDSVTSTYDFQPPNAQSAECRHLREKDKDETFMKCMMDESIKLYLDEQFAPKFNEMLIRTHWEAPSPPSSSDDLSRTLGTTHTFEHNLTDQTLD